MSARSLSYTPPAPSVADPRLVSVSVGELRRLRAAVAYLAAVAAETAVYDPDTDDPADEPDDSRALADAGFVLAALLGPVV